MSQEVQRAPLISSIVAVSVSIVLAVISFAFLALSRVGLRHTEVLVQDSGNPNPIVLVPSYNVSTAMGLSPLTVATICGAVALVGLIIAALVLTQSLANKKFASFAIGLCLAAIVAGLVFAI